MCGILGTPKITDEVSLMLPLVAYGMVTRGKDAWGATDGHNVIKHLGPLHQSWKTDYQEKILDWRSCIIHTRAASGGTGRNSENAHPFEFTGPDGLHVIGIHNGYITNHNAIGEKYQRTYQVDSEHIWMHRANRLPWSELHGYGNLAWYEDINGGPSELYIMRTNSNDLHCVEVGDGGIIFASEMDILRLAANMYGVNIEKSIIIPEDVVCHVRADGVFQTQDKVGFSTFAGTADARTGSVCGFVPTYPAKTVTQITEGKKPQETQLCYKCWKHVDRDKFLLCDDCYDRYYSLWEFRQETTRAIAQSTGALIN